MIEYHRSTSTQLQIKKIKKKNNIRIYSVARLGLIITIKWI